MIELIIFDMYRTLWGSGKGPREGTQEFFERYSDRKFVIATDDPDPDAVRELLEEIGVSKYFTAIYGSEDMNIFEGKRGKDLARICSEQGTNIENAIFIGDAFSDKADAKRVGMKFVHVPEYITEDETFSYEMLSIDKMRAQYNDFRSVNYP